MKVHMTWGLIGAAELKYGNQECQAFHWATDFQGHLRIFFHKHLVLWTGKTAQLHLDAQAPFSLTAAGTEYSLVRFELVEPRQSRQELRLCVAAPFADCSTLPPFVPPPVIHSPNTLAPASVRHRCSFQKPYLSFASWGC